MKIQLIPPPAPNPRSRIRVILLARKGLFTQLLCDYLNATAKFKVLGPVSSPTEALERSGNSQADLLAVDAGSFRPTELLTIVKRIRERFPKTRIVEFNAAKDWQNVQAAVDLGVTGYIDVDATPTEFLRGLLIAHAGKVFIGKTISRLAASSAELKPEEAHAKRDITARERQVMTEVAKGKRTKEIAEILSISSRTVENHRQNYARKVSASSCDQRVATVLKS